MRKHLLRLEYEAHLMALRVQALSTSARDGMALLPDRPGSGVLWEEDTIKHQRIE